MSTATKKTGTLQQVLQQHAHTAQTDYNARVLAKLQVCRTSALGYHLYKCKDDGCDTYKYQYHSCRNRHCPQCGALQRIQWVEDRQRELLPVPYYHIVFTLPHELNSIIMGNRKNCYNLLFKAASSTLLQFGKDQKYLGAQLGILAVLHTWGQQLSFHPHLHCIVSGGGVATKKNMEKDKCVYWKNTRRDSGNFLFPVKAMSVVYKAIFLKGLKKAIAKKEINLNEAQQKEVKQLLENLYYKPWVVYAKKPFGGPQQVVQYLAAYTHKVAISNNRILSIENGNVSFKWKDYRHENAPKQMSLTASEFLRRFEQHNLSRNRRDLTKRLYQNTQLRISC
jgi:predicted nucleic acid-binding Zn ribbon protein